MVPVHGVLCTNVAYRVWEHKTVELGHGIGRWDMQVIILIMISQRLSPGRFRGGLWFSLRYLVGGASQSGRNECPN
jgi:hypothetical protein